MWCPFVLCPHVRPAPPLLNLVGSLSHRRSRLIGSNTSISWTGCSSAIRYCRSGIPTLVALVLNIQTRWKSSFMQSTPKLRRNHHVFSIPSWNSSNTHPVPPSTLPTSMPSCLSNFFSSRIDLLKYIPSYTICPNCPLPPMLSARSGLSPLRTVLLIAASQQELDAHNVTSKCQKSFLLALPLFIKLLCLLALV